MTFRANEEQAKGVERALARLVGPSIEASQREKSRQTVIELIDRYGPVVEAYPSWHPLVFSHDPHTPVTTPSRECGYEGLDHSIYLRDAIISCPYGGTDEIIVSVAKLAENPRLNQVADLQAEPIEAQLYHPDATPVLIKCIWTEPIAPARGIPASIAVPLLLEQELQCWRRADVAETWKTMAPYFLGRPYGSRSSLFLDQDAGQALKTLWNTIINTGMFGPIQVSR